MNALVAAANIGLGLIYTCYGVMTIIDLKNGWRTNGFSHFGLAYRPGTAGERQLARR